MPSASIIKKIPCSKENLIKMVLDIEKYPEFVPRYRSVLVENIIKKYVALAKDHQLSPAQLALAFVYSQQFVTSNIIGPSNIEQLIEDTEALNIELSSEVLEAIEVIHEECPNICA